MAELKDISLFGAWPMRKFVYWFLGDTAGRVLTAWWRWFWGKSISQGNTVTLEAARESLTAMQASVSHLTVSVSQVAAVYSQAQEKFLKHNQDYDEANAQAALALKEGNEAAARLAVTRAITLEKALPSLAKMAQQSQELLHHAKQDLQNEQEKLEACRLEMGNLQAIAEMNEALSAVMKVTQEVGVDSAQSQFNQAESIIKHKNLQVIAQRELSQPPNAALQQELDTLTQADAIEQRLAALRDATPSLETHEGAPSK